ncbi:alpha/beta hydrolase [Clostridiaceae bacterium M8S5]|nr:alpha/beta hydrolase [Clostridiaceae bacterium M8S5]
MKKVLWIAIGLVVIIVLLPFITGDMESKDLNEITRADIGGSFAKLSDGYTHYELKGNEDAKVIVLVHGNAAPAVTWDYNIQPLLDEGYRVLRYDIYGHGYSDRPKLKEYNKSLYDNQLMELLEKLHIKEPVYLVGTSQGGSICAYFAAEHPRLVDKIALLAPLFDDFEGKNRLKLMQTKVGDYLMGVMGDKLIIKPASMLSDKAKKEELEIKLKNQLIYKGKKRAVLANMRGDSLHDAKIYYEKVKQQNISTLLTWGENDKSIPKQSMDRLRVTLPNMEFHLIKNASHLAHYEFPEKINSILIDFFKK